MNFQKKLTIASILMILIPIIVSSFLCLFLFLYKGEKDIAQIKTLYENDNGLLNVQTILYNYREDILSYDPDEETDDKEEDENPEDDDKDHDDKDREEEKEEAFGMVIKELTILGYRYQISCNQQVLVTNLSEQDKQEILSLAGTNYEKLGNFMISEEESSVVKRIYKEEGNYIEILAYCSSYVSGIGAETSLIRELLMIVGAFVLFFTIAMILSIFFLTKWLSGGIKKSLGELSQGVAQIREGNLSYRIHSEGKDEIGAACNEFDEMAEVLEKSVEEKEYYEAGRKQMLAGISHDLRTPLTSIRAYAEGLKDGIANTEEKKTRYYKAILTRVRDLEGLVDNLSVFSRLDKGENSYTMKKMELNDLLTAFFHDHEILFEKKHFTVEWGTWPKEPLFINGDWTQLTRVLQNITENTIKYRKKDRTVFKIFLYKKGKQVILEMEDDGPGISQEETRRIFDAFYRGDEARMDPGSGSGLGLSIVKRIIEDHGGRIFAGCGKEGTGFQIQIEFPLYTAG